MKIIGDTLLLTPMTEQDVEAVQHAWAEYRYIPHSEVSKARFLYSVQRAAQDYDPTFSAKHTLYLAIRSKDADVTMGYTVWKIVPDSGRVDFVFTILLEEYREHGVYSELNVLRHKYVYRTGSPIHETWVRLSQDRPRQATSLAALYTAVDQELDLIKYGKMHWSHIVRNDWEIWINHEDQAAKRDAAFVLEE
jgi:hypothetical protein